LFRTRTSANSNEQIDDGSGVLFAEALAAIGKEVAGAIVPVEVEGVHHRDHRVQPRDVPEAFAVLGDEVKGGRHGHGFRDAGAFNEEVVETPLGGEAPNLCEQVLSQGAADAPVGHFHEALFGPRQVCAALPDQRSVDIDLAHVVHDDSDAQAFAVSQNMVQQGGLSGAEEAGQDSDGQLDQGHPPGLDICYTIT